MDERTLTIVKAMALTPTCYDDNSNIMCVHCDSYEYSDVSGFVGILHKSGCPVLLARAILKERGIHINIYKVVHEYVSTVTPNRQYTRKINFYTIATTLEEATQGYVTYKDTDNVHAEFVQELPMQG